MIKIFCYDGAQMQNLVFRDIRLEEYTAQVDPELTEYGFELHKPADYSSGQVYLVYAYVKRRDPDTPLGSIDGLVLKDLSSLGSGYATPSSFTNA